MKIKTIENRIGAPDYEQVYHVESPEDERLRICNKTASHNHLWGFILRRTGEWWLNPIYEVDLKASYNKKCVACGLVDDVRPIDAEEQ